jgi:pantoate--beta-alanine ligase
MKVFQSASELQNAISALDKSPVGFVPTMGALHSGHLSLIKTAMELCPLAVASIYVNPTQFNDKNDLRNYPRTPEADLELLGSIMRENDMVFMPGDKEIYPDEDKRKFSFGNLDHVMEAVHRPGHFNGVAQVVSRLFDLVRPDIAIFGMKDFQQLAVIRELVRQTGNKVRITGNPIIREKDGLAMSSRNRLLEPSVRANAPVIFKTLSEAALMAPGFEIGEINSFVKNKINVIPDFEVEYFDIVDDTELVPLVSMKDVAKGKRYFGCIAVKAGHIRLLDNVEFTLL